MACWWWLHGWFGKRSTSVCVNAARLEAYFLRCSKEASLTLLPLQDAVACAVAWDTLLRREFRGDVEALLGWWRERRDD